MQVREIMSRQVITLQSQQTIEEVEKWLTTRSPDASHQGFPVLDNRGNLVGVVTRRDLLQPEVDRHAKIEQVVHRLPKFVCDDCTVRQAADHMINHNIGRLPVIRRGGSQLVGIVTRSDIRSVFRFRVAEMQGRQQTGGNRVFDPAKPSLARRTQQFSAAFLSPDYSTP